MKISFILPTASMAGGIRVVAIYAKALCEMGHEVVLVSPPPRILPFKDKLKSIIKGKGWPTPRGTKSHLDDISVTHLILDEWRPVVDDDVPDADVIIATWWETAEWIMALSDKKGAKVYFVQHHEVHPYLPIERCKATYRFPMHKIVIAKWLENTMDCDYNDTEVDLVSNSVDHEQFFAPVRGKQNIPTVGFLYSKSSYKGVDITLEVINKLRNKFPELRVISFGSVKPVDMNELGERIEFHHSPEQDEIRDIYSKCDIWITASKTEGFNLPAMEAMACRTPVASTKAGWPEEVIEEGVNGVLVNVDDVDALSNGIASILSLSDEEWMKISEGAYQTTAESSWDVSAELFEDALKNACVRSSRGEISGMCRGNIDEQ